MRLFLVLDEPLSKLVVALAEPAPAGKRAAEAQTEERETRKDFEGTISGCAGVGMRLVGIFLPPSMS